MVVSSRYVARKGDLLEGKARTTGEGGGRRKKWAAQHKPLRQMINCRSFNFLQVRFRFLAIDSSSCPTHFSALNVSWWRSRGSWGRQRWEGRLWRLVGAPAHGSELCRYPEPLEGGDGNVSSARHHNCRFDILLINGIRSQGNYLCLLRFLRKNHASPSYKWALRIA